MELSGLEVLYFLQAKKGAWGKSQSLSTMIQTAMVTTHGIIEDSARTIIFADSLDVAGRIRSDLRDAEQTRRLWEMRIARQTPDFTFRGQGCPQSTPLLCSNLYLAGECWRGALGGAACCQAIPGLRMAPAVPQLITGSTSGNRAFQAPVIIGTSALEVGVDDPTVRATLHYRPPRTVFNFTQRRGRAGRNYGDVAYSIVVLGQKPSDFVTTQDPPREVQRQLAPGFARYTSASAAHVDDGARVIGRSSRRRAVPAARPQYR